MNTLQTNSKNPASSKTATPDIERIYHYTNEEVLAMLESSPAGLSSQQIKERQDRDGKNIIKEAKEKSILLVFLSNFVSVMAILLWVSGFIAILARMPELGIAIWCVNLINGVFSFWQEYQAGKATEALKKMLPSYSRVIRDGTEQQILAEDLVVGDIILVTEGDKISADARLLEATDLQVNQSTLTGESNPVRKVSDPVYRDDVTRSEIPNLIFAGTSVSSGNGKAVVISTGMNTMFGNIAKLTQSMKEEKSPLQKELDKLTQQISAIALGFGVLFFVLAVFFVRDPIAKSFIFSLGMVVAFIPEGLLPTVTLSLAMAVQRMAKEHALVKKLSAVETLGCTSVICSDKTGTLTQNEMTVSNLYLFDRELEVSGTGYAPEGEIQYRGKAVTANEDKDLRLLLTAAGLCSNARLIEPNENNPQYTVLGDPTEACLGVVARKGGLDPKSLNEEQPRIRELPFDSSRKRMTTIHEVDNRRVAYVKGAPKEVIELCSDRIQEGMKIPLTDLDREKLMAINDTYAR
ncbi:MAG TPA: cation-transporting P-type ATPase, partial [Flexilinea sp.]|nr:cation-transporting P-type ATPase [Flexilinea sp.]